MKNTTPVRKLVNKIVYALSNLGYSASPLKGRRTMNASSPRLSCLRLEALESREMLVASGEDFYGPPTYEQYLLRQLAQTAEAEQASPLYAAPFLNSLQNANGKSNSIISLTIQDLNNSPSLPNLDTDEFFANLGVNLLGEPYLALTFAQKNQMYLDSVDVDEPVEPPADEDAPTWDLEFQVTRYCADSSATTPEGVDNALHEGHGSVLGFPGSLGDPSSSDYLAVTLPALPRGYMANITLGGTASASDYSVYIPYSGGSTSVTNGYVHSGNAATLYIVPIDDRITEALETVTLSMGAPYHNDYAEPETIYSFNIINTSVTATIIDNDDWEIAVYPVVDDSELEYTLLTEENETEASFRVARVDAGSGYGEDKHYAIDATLRFTGSANARGYDADYYVYLNNADGSRTLLTPNYSGDVTVQIPENELYATITIKAKDDSTVERLQETIELKVNSAASYPLSYIPYNVSSDSVQIKINDNDVFRVTTVRFLDNLDLYSDSIGSFGTNWKDDIHWLESDSTQTLPVAYSSDATMKCQITLNGTPDYTQTYQVRMKWNRTNNTAVYSDWQTVSVYSSCYVDLGLSFASIFGSPQAYYDSSSEIEWEFKISGDDERGELGEMGTSANPLYVTYKEPLENTTNYLTLVHLGCSAANGVNGSSEVSVFQAIWAKFQSKSISKVDLIEGAVEETQLLSYYGKTVQEEINGWDDETIYLMLSASQNKYGVYLNSDQSPSIARQIDLAYNGGLDNTIGLLLFKDGTCESWVDFARNVYAIQGITVSSAVIRTSSSTNTYFKVDPSLTGQGGAQPKENVFHGHIILYYDNTENYYDPSYGLHYGTSTSVLENFIGHVHSIGVRSNQSHGSYGTTYTVAKDHGELTETDFSLSFS